jgi:thermitase
MAAAIAAVGCAPVPGQSPLAPPAAPAWTPEDGAPALPGDRVYRLADTPMNRVILKSESDRPVDLAVQAGLARLVQRLPAMDAAVLELTGSDLDAGLQALRALPGVAYVEREGVSVVGWNGARLAAQRPAASAPATVSAVGRTGPNDPRFSDQWAFKTIGELSVWGAAALAAASTRPIITIAILDTGIDQDHEDLDPTHHTDDQVGKLYRDINFTASDTVDDRFGHGTHVAGIAAALTDNGLGVAGTAGEARLFNVKVIGDNGIGYDAAIASGIRWAADHGAQILNMSFGQPDDSTLIKEAVAYAAGKGVLMVAAAGNEGKAIKRYPAAYPEVLAVGATTMPRPGQPERRASFSNYGEWVDVAAPGESILSTFPNHPTSIKVINYGYMNGTSMATPMVSGEAALLWTAYGGDAARVRARIESKSDTSVAGSGQAWVHGRIDVYRALQEP